MEFEGMNLVIAYVKDPDGCSYELIQRENPTTSEPLCQVMLCVEDLDRSINFYQKVIKLINKCSILFFLIFPNLQTTYDLFLFLNLCRPWG